jgi:hypothetical protein
VEECSYACACKACCDASSTEMCTESIHYAVGQLQPARGAVRGGTPVTLTVPANSTAVYASTGRIACRFGAALVPGVYLNSSAVSCTAPALALAAPQLAAAAEAVTRVPVLLSLDGDQWTDSGVSGSSSETVYSYVRCDASSSNSSSDSSCSAGGKCSTDSGDCECDAEHTGDACELQCPAVKGKSFACTANLSKQLPVTWMFMIARFAVCSYS